MEKSKDRLTTVQIFILVFSSLVGVGILTLPRSITEDVGVGGMITLTLGGAIAIGATAIMAKLSQRFPHKNIVEYSQIILGRIPGLALMSLLGIYFVLAAGAITRTFSDVIKVFLLRNTPLEVIMITMILVAMYLVQHGIQPLTRICEAFFPLLLLSLTLLLVFPVADFRFDEFRSVFATGIMPIARAIPTAVLAFIGMEIVFFVSPYMEQPKKLLVTSVSAVAAVLFVYMAVLVVTIGAFGIDMTHLIMYPTLSLARYVSFPGAFLERFDILFVAFWILATFTTIAVYYYMAGFTITRIAGLKNFKPIMYALVPIVYLVGIIPQNIIEIFQWVTYISYGGGIIILVVPGLLYLVSLLRKRGEDVGSKG